MLWLIPAIALPIIGLCCYVPFRVQRRMQVALLIKCALSVGFILYALFAGLRLTRVGDVEPWAGTLIWFTVAGMVFCLLGDVWLDLKDFEHADRVGYQRYFMFCGFSSFMIGHLFFIVGMASAYRLPGWAWPVAALAGLVIAGANLFLERPLKLNYGPYRTILAAYSTVIGVATVIPIAAAIHVASEPGHSWQPLIFSIGMVLFLLSDLVLSQIYFAAPEVASRTVNYVLNYLFYFGAQYTLALSLYLLPYHGLPS